MLLVPYRDATPVLTNEPEGLEVQYLVLQFSFHGAAIFLLKLTEALDLLSVLNKVVDMYDAHRINAPQLVNLAVMCLENCRQWPYRLPPAIQSAPARAGDTRFSWSGQNLPVRSDHPASVQ
jgi:hypothetical protein